MTKKNIIFLVSPPSDDEFPYFYTFSVRNSMKNWFSFFNFFSFFFFPRALNENIFLPMLTQKKMIPLFFGVKWMFNVTWKLAENPEHVPLLVLTPATAASKHQKPNAAATTINIPTNVTNGTGLIEHSDQRPISPVLLSSNTPAHVMRSRLNQYKASGKFQKNVIVNYDGDNGTTVSTSKVSTTVAKGKKKKKAVDF